MHNPEKSENGKTVDFLLTKRDVAVAEDFSGGRSRASGRLPCAITRLMVTRLRMAAREILSQHRRRERTRKLYQSFFSSHALRSK